MPYNITYSIEGEEEDFTTLDDYSLKFNCELRVKALREECLKVVNACLGETNNHKSRIVSISDLIKAEQELTDCEKEMDKRGLLK